MVTSLMRLRSARIVSALAEVDIGWSQIVDALMIADVIVVLDEGVRRQVI